MDRTESEPRPRRGNSRPLDVDWRDLRVDQRDVRRAGAITLGAALLAGALSFLLPSWYTASATFTVDSTPTLNLGGAGMLGLASQLGLGGALGSGTTSAQYFADVLGSPAVTDRVALGAIPHSPNGDLTNDFGSAGLAAAPKKRDAARKKFAKHFGTSVNARTSTITFSVDSRTPYAAKAAADTLLSRLNAVVIELRRRRASAERTFIERRLDSAAVRQLALEDTLRSFYATNRMTAGSPNLQFVEARLRRRVDFAVDLANQLRTQLEQAKLQEVRDTPVLSVITSPEEPGRRSAPNRRLIVLAALVLGAAVALADYARRRGIIRSLLARQS